MKLYEKKCKAVDSSQFNKERTFHIHVLVGSFCIFFQKYMLRQGFRISLVLNLFLIFDHISGSCSYNTVRIKRRRYYTEVVTWFSVNLYQ